MNIRARLNMQVYERRLWLVMLAGCATRFTALRSEIDAVFGFITWVLIFTGCWALRRLLWRGADGKRNAEKAANAIAIIGMLLFAIRLSGEGATAALLTLLFAVQAALFIVAQVRLHLWLVIAAGLAGVMFAAAESRSVMFVPAAAWFTFAALGLLAFDQHASRAAAASAVLPISARRSHGGAQFAVLVLLIALPVYLFVPRPEGLKLGGMQATAAHDYSEEPSADSQEPAEMDISPYSDAEPLQDAGLESALPALPAPSQPMAGVYGDEWSISDIERSDGNGQGNAVVLYVRTSQPLYLRGKLFDRFEGDRWHRTPHARDSRPLQRGEYQAAESGPLAVEQTVEVMANLDATLIHTPTLQALRFPGPVIYEYDDGVFAAPRPLRADTTYSVIANVDLLGGRYLLAEAAPDDRYLAVPGEISEQVRDLTQQITQNAGSAQERAFRLEKWLRENYQYSFQTVQWQGYTPLDWFLFEGRQGHCEYFASALAMMLRIAGIPSRVATGFSLGERNPMTGYYEVRQLDGHAWVEAYLDGGGWLMLEPTPFYPLPQQREAQANDMVEQLDRYLERLSQTSQALDPQSLRTTVIELARESWVSVRSVLRQINELPAQLGWRLPVLIAVALLMVLIGRLLLLTRRDMIENGKVRRLVAGSNGPGRRALLDLSDALQIAAASRGAGRQAHETMREYAARGDCAGQALPEDFAELFEQSRYGSEDVSAPVKTLERLRHIIAEALQQVPWPHTSTELKRWNAALRTLLSYKDAAEQSTHAD